MTSTISEFALPELHAYRITETQRQWREPTPDAKNGID